ncbi:MAG: sugar transferase [Chloroflexota bacterium]|nr:sugar transferase [Chloroflexota bacterium]
MSSQAYSKEPGFQQSLRSFDFNSIYSKGRKLAKRAFDIVMSLIGLIILAPVFVYVAILIKRDSPGPIFFWGSRMGRGGKPFKMLKFRTMYERIESYQGPPVTANGDARITPLGQWLRDTKINELPQLWNVLIGEMSLVGPRPEDVEISRSWPQDAFDEILSVSPGVTSPASILYHDEEKLLSNTNVMGDYLKGILPNKLRLDRLYVRHCSFFSDLDAIFWTIAIIIPRVSNTKIPEGYLFAGPISRLIHRYINWFLIDLLIASFVAYIASFTWKSTEPLTLTTEAMVVPFILTILFTGINSLIGLNRVFWSQATLDDALGLLVSSGIATTLIWALNYMRYFYEWLPFSPLPTNMIIFIGIVAGFGFISARYRLRLLTTLATRWLNWRQEASRVGERVLIIGLGDGNRIAHYLLKQRTFRTAFSVVGVVDNNNPSQHGMRVSGSWMLGGISDIPELIKRHDIGLILSTIPARSPENEHILEFCQLAQIKLIFIDDLMSVVNRQVTRPLGKIDAQSLFDGRLEFKAMHDILTGLPNRSLLQDRLKHSIAHAKRYKTQPALVFVEFEEIVKITETFGEKVSGRALKDVVSRLSSCKRESDTLARFGFDKFALLLENVPGEQEMEIITQRIGNAMLEPLDVNGNQLLMVPKIGVCMCQMTCGAFDIPNTVEIARCYGCAVSKGANRESEKLRVDA